MSSKDTVETVRQLVALVDNISIDRAVALVALTGLWHLVPEPRLVAIGGGVEIMQYRPLVTAILLTVAGYVVILGAVRLAIRFFVRDRKQHQLREETLVQRLVTASPSEKSLLIYCAQRRERTYAGISKNSAWELFALEDAGLVKIRQHDNLATVTLAEEVFQLLRRRPELVIEHPL